MTKWLGLLLPVVFASTALADAPARHRHRHPARRPAKTAPVAPVAPVAAAQVTRIEVSVTKRGFAPDSISVPAKQPVTLVFTRKTEQTCTKSVVVTLDDGKTIERDLPLDQAVEIAVTFPKAGKLGYACSMDMNKGVIVVN